MVYMEYSTSICRRMDEKGSTILTDADIVKRIVDGDVDAFEFLLDRYQRYVFEIIRKHVPYQQVEEISQEVFINVFQSLAGWKKKDGFKQWLYAIAVRTCYNYWRKRYRSKEVPIGELSDNATNWLEKAIYDQTDNHWEDPGAKEEAKAVLDWALSKLSAEDRMVLELVYLEGHTGKEAAGLLGWSLANVKVRSFRARKKLREMLIKSGWSNDE